MSDESEIIYEKILFQNDDKGFQVRLVVNEFKGVEYLHLRKYFLSFDEGFIPSKEGISIPASIHNVFGLLDALIEVCASEESIDSITTHFANKISDLKSKSE